MFSAVAADSQHDRLSGSHVFATFSLSSLSFIIFAAISSTIGNWLSIRFPKHMRFGKRLNVSGVAGLLLIPMVVVLATPPLLATVVGYFTRSLFN